MHTLRCSIRRLTMLAALLPLVCFAPRAAGQDSAAKEKELIAVLQSGAPGEKALACKQLAIHGGKAAVPELAKLLSDEKLASWARIALEAIPDPVAGEALRKALDSLKGRLAIGTINSLGVRRDEAAVKPLAKRLTDENAEVAAAAAVALGQIGNAEATKTLRELLAFTQGPLRSAVAEGLVLCAERLLAGGKSADAAKVYDEVRVAEVPKPRKLEATRGAILARQAEGIPLLVEQLRSPDRGFLNIGLSVARELPGRGVAEALAGELERAAPDRAALLLYALADRKDSVVSPAVLGAARQGAKEVRIAAVGLIGRLGTDAQSLEALVNAATDSDAELAQSALTAIRALPGKVNGEIVARLAKADGKELGVLIEAVGVRRISATPALVAALDHAEPSIRQAALSALGETVSQKELAVLIAQALNPKHAQDAEAARKGLKAACIRMPDREACAAELASAMQRASVANQAYLVEVLGEMRGKKSLATIAAVMKGGNEQLQEAGSRVLGEWLGTDAAPVLLDLAKTASSDKHQVRALRGYIRLARQFQMTEAERAEMCKQALAAARRVDEQKLVLAVLERYPNLPTLKVAIQTIQTPGLKDDAAKTVLVMGRKLADKSPEAVAMLAEAGIKLPKLEILKAQYGAGSAQKDVTETVRKQLAESAGKAQRVIYNQIFGGDPAPNVVKQLKVRYKIDGKEAEATFDENAPIVLPAAK